MYKGPEWNCCAPDCRRPEPQLTPDVKKGLHNLKAIKDAYQDLVKEGIPMPIAAQLVAAAFK